MTQGFRQFYSGVPLRPDSDLSPPEELRHRLATVLRYKEGDTLHLFDGANGCFAATIAEPKARRLRIGACVKPFAPSTGPALFIGLPKREAFETVLRQAAELGVTAVHPLLTDFAVPTRLNMERARALLVEAAEQCERLDIPALSEPLPLEQGLSSYKGTIAWADEAGGGKAAKADALLVGPEGGFSPAERQLLKARANVQPITLGRTVLRVDTAVVAGLTRLSS
jgi:16S rRNA (uracil1498-N3)-methyltransferase